MFCWRTSQYQERSRSNLDGSLSGELLSAGVASPRWQGSPGNDVPMMCVKPLESQRNKDMEQGPKNAVAAPSSLS